MEKLSSSPRGQDTCSSVCLCRYTCIYQTGIGSSLRIRGCYLFPVQIEIHGRVETSPEETGLIFFFICSFIFSLPSKEKYFVILVHIKMSGESLKLCNRNGWPPKGFLLSVPSSFLKENRSVVLKISHFAPKFQQHNCGSKWYTQGLVCPRKKK